MAELADQTNQAPAQAIYTNVNYDPDASVPWSQRTHYRVSGFGELSDNQPQNMHSPLPPELPLSPPSRWTTNSSTNYDGTTSVYGSTVRETNNDSNCSLD